MGVRLKMGNLRSGFNAVLLFGLMLACLHLYTLRQRMHQLETKMMSARDGHNIVRRSLAAKEEPESMPDSSAQVDRPGEKQFIDKNLGKAKNFEEERSVDLSKPKDLEEEHPVDLHKPKDLKEEHPVDLSKLQDLEEEHSVDLRKPQDLEKHSVDLSKPQDLEEHSVDLGKPQHLQEEHSVDLSNPKDLGSISLAKNDVKATNTTLAPKPAPTTTTSAVQKPVTSTPSPHATSKPPEPLINPHNFSFIINNPEKCGDGDVLLLILVTTTAQGQVQRETIRKTWGNESNIPGVVIKTVFAIGHTDDAQAQAALVEENAKFKDIIQEDFVDSYHNLTLKTVMCWKWAFQYCPKARFIMKADDDTFVNIFSVTRHLIGLLKYHAKQYVTGWVYVDTKPIRDPMSQWNKWYVKYEDYPRDTYPKYPCGFAYVISNDFTKVLYETSETIKYLFLEDAFLGLCMEKLGVEPVHHGGFVPWYTHIDSCQFDWLMASHWVKSYEYMWYLWNTLTSC